MCKNSMGMILKTMSAGLILGAAVGFAAEKMMQPKCKSKKKLERGLETIAELVKDCFA